MKTDLKRQNSLEVLTPRFRLSKRTSYDEVLLLVQKIKSLDSHEVIVDCAAVTGLNRQGVFLLLELIRASFPTKVYLRGLGARQMRVLEDSGYDDLFQYCEKSKHEFIDEDAEGQSEAVILDQPAPNLNINSLLDLDILGMTYRERLYRHFRKEGFEKVTFVKTRQSSKVGTKSTRVFDASTVVLVGSRTTNQLQNPKISFQISRSDDARIKSETQISMTDLSDLRYLIEASLEGRIVALLPCAPERGGGIWSWSDLPANFNDRATPPLYVGRNVDISATSEIIGPAVIGDNSKIGPNTLNIRSVLLRNSTLKQGDFADTLFEKVGKPDTPERLRFSSRRVS